MQCSSCAGIVAGAAQLLAMCLAGGFRLLLPSTKRDRFAFLPGELNRSAFGTVSFCIRSASSASNPTALSSLSLPLSYISLAATVEPVEGLVDLSSPSLLSRPSSFPSTGASSRTSVTPARINDAPLAL